ncbi:gliding motility-associated C-terminal domain-containing protein [Taibaiella lutea]|uniref:Gliding motility-associated C-terminal domain-containing protein n=1 Tax=Taibaiella lutea TaxID=2608001 RepID=A0A5M6CCN7_9BACT|nr:gliding motility-associated C-terminal domain-containing protein [Taibaiella lutea]KAA5532220.1 gliding motility-associated C-terminal domain-containing protein [Taibaiella lutea]
MKKNLLLFLLSMLLCVASFYHLYAQEQASQHTRYAGKNFWITMQDYSAFNEFYLSSIYNATLTFTYTFNNTIHTVNVPPDTIIKITIPISEIQLAMTSAFETVQNRSLHIVSDSDIVVQYAGWGSMEDDGGLIYPSDRQKYGDVYFLNGLPYLSFGQGSVGNTGNFSIVATCDNVMLEITPSKNLTGHPAGVPFNVMLNKGQTYAIGNAANNPLKDLSGTKIEVKNASCCNPINVFNTGACGFSYWPYTASFSDYPACDFFFDQILPVSSWDTSYYVLPYSNNPFTIIKIVSSGNNNMVTLNGAGIATLSEGGTLDTIIREPVHIASSLPVSISQHMIAQKQSYTQVVVYPNIGPVDSLSDPNSAMVISMRDGIREAWFQTVGNTSGLLAQYFYLQKQVIAIVSKIDNLPSILLNNSSIASQFLPFPANPDYAYAYITPDTGIIYHLTSSDKIVANYYAGAYHGSIDFALGDVNPYLFFDEVPTDTIKVCAMDREILDAGPGLSHEWSTGQTSEEINVTDTGLYSVLTFQDDDCIGKLKKFLIKSTPSYLVPMTLGADTSICEEHTIVLHGQGPFTVWSTGETTDSIIVQEPGIYWATLQDTCTLEITSDTIVINEISCLDRYCNFNLPNAFSPNNDGLNDLLLPVYFGQIDNYSLNIYNRLGQRVFSTAQPDEGWDGNFKGQPSDLGVYFYNCVFYCPLYGNVHLKGDVSLLR